LRQAYDYWQDQPGNYFPKTTSVAHRLLTVCRGALSAFTTWSSSTFVHSGPTAACRRLPSPRGGVQATSNPQMASPCFPFSHVLSKIPLSRGETKVTALGEDYQRPATPERHATDVADPLVVSCIRIDHRQAIHLLQHRSIASHKDGSRLQR
jgi:hypothetical protein